MGEVETWGGAVGEVERQGCGVSGLRLRVCVCGVYVCVESMCVWSLGFRSVSGLRLRVWRVMGNVRASRCFPSYIPLFYVFLSSIYSSLLCVSLFYVFLSSLYSSFHLPLSIPPSILPSAPSLSSFSSAAYTQSAACPRPRISHLHQSLVRRQAGGDSDQRLDGGGGGCVASLPRRRGGPGRRPPAFRPL